MDSLGATSHPFVIRIWLEESAEEDRRATWRGHITHVPSGQRRYLENLDDIAAFIAPYLEGMGVKFSLTRRARWCLRRLRHRRAGHWIPSLISKERRKKGQAA